MGVSIIECAEEQPVSEVFQRVHAANLADANPALVAHFIPAITVAETARQFSQRARTTTEMSRDRSCRMRS